MTNTYTEFSELLNLNIKTAYYEKYSEFPNDLNFVSIRDYFINESQARDTSTRYNVSYVSYTNVYTYIDATYTVIPTGSTDAKVIYNQYIYLDTPSYSTPNYNYDVVINDVESLETRYNPMNLGNGKIVMTTKNLYNKMNRVYISTLFETNDTEDFNKNTVETFNNMNYHLYSYDNKSLLIENYKEKLNMYNGKFIKSYDYTKTNTVNITQEATEYTYSVTDTTIILRQFPYCSLKRITVKADAGLVSPANDPDPFIFYQEILTPDNINDYVYSNDIVLNSHNLQFMFFNVEGKVENINSEKKLFTNYNTYVSKSGIATISGYEQRKDNSRIGYNKISIDFTSLGSGNYEVDFYILGVHMSQYDFSRPKIESKKILVNILNNVTTQYIKTNLYNSSGNAGETDASKTLTQPFAINGYYPLYTTSDKALAHNGLKFDTYHTLIYSIQDKIMKVTDVDFEDYNHKRKIILYRPTGLTEQKHESSSVDETHYYDGKYIKSAIPVTNIDLSNLEDIITNPTANTETFFEAFTDKIITEHTLKWGYMWDSLIEIKQKSGNDAETVQIINHWNRLIKTSLYNLYSLIRNDINIDINPLNLSILDLDGSIYWTGELWIIPTLIFLQPDMAKTILNFRYKQLENAKRLAAAHGHKGSRFAYSENEISYNDVFWSAQPSIYVFNTALVSINAWNYFRVTEDMNWLKEKGYDMIKNNADFLMSKITKYYSKAHSINYYSLDDVLSLNSTNSRNNNFISLYFTRIAIRFALEATYLLGYTPSKIWSDFYNAYIALPIYYDGKICIDDGELGKYVAAYTGATSGNEQTQGNTALSNLNILEPLIATHPYYSHMLYNEQLKVYINESTIFTLNGGTYLFKSSELNKNLLVYSGKINTEYETNIINLIILGFSYFKYAQSLSIGGSQIPLATFQEKIALGVNMTTSLPWNNFISLKDLNSTGEKLNDISTSCQFILSFISYIMNIRITGGVSVNGSVFEPFGLTTSGGSSDLESLSAGNFPSTWDSVLLRIRRNNATTSKVQSFNIQ